MKECTNCKIKKELNAFGKKASSKDDLDGYCRDCRKVYYKNKNYNRKEYHTLYKRVITEERKLYLKEYGLKNKHKYINKYKVIKINKGTNDTLTIKKINNLVRRTLNYKNEEKLMLSKSYLGWTKYCFIKKFGIVPKDYQIDHKIPVSWFLKDAPINIINSLDNLQLLHKDENLKKSNKFCHPIPIEFFEVVKSYVSDFYIDRITHY
jgi:hypothetical protein